jgi:hypothetical protein
MAFHNNQQPEGEVLSGCVRLHCVYQFDFSIQFNRHMSLVAMASYGRVLPVKLFTYNSDMAFALRSPV